MLFFSGGVSPPRPPSRQPCFLFPCSLLLQEPSGMSYCINSAFDLAWSFWGRTPFLSLTRSVLIKAGTSGGTSMPPSNSHPPVTDSFNSRFAMVESALIWFSTLCLEFFRTSNGILRDVYLLRQFLFLKVLVSQWVSPSRVEFSFLSCTFMWLEVAELDPIHQCLKC